MARDAQDAARLVPDRRLFHDHIHPDAARRWRAGPGQLGRGRVRGQLSSPGTRQAYTTQLRLWFDWCEKHHLEPLADVRRPHVELYARDLEARGLAAATVALKLVVLTGLYRDFRPPSVVAWNRPTAGTVA